MEILPALNKMEEIERKASELYRRYHTIFYYQQEAAYFFYKLYIEEKGHANLVQYVRRLVRQNPKLFQALDYSKEDFDKILNSLDSEISRKRPLTLLEALETAEELEVTLSEGFIRQLPLKTNSILLDLYSALGECDHTERISAFKAKMLAPNQAERFSSAAYDAEVS